MMRCSLLRSLDVAEFGMRGAVGVVAIRVWDGEGW